MQKNKTSKQLFAFAEQGCLELMPLWQMSSSQIPPLPFLLFKKCRFFHVSLQKRTGDTRPAQSKTSTEPTSRSQIPSGLPCHYSKIFHADEICVFVCLTKTEKEKARETLLWFMKSCLSVCISDCVVVVCVCVCASLSERVFQWSIYDTPFTSGGASCLSFFIPRSLMGLWWWWRDGPSPPALMPPWDEEGPPPPRPPEECCTLRSLLPSTRIWSRK